MAEARRQLFKRKDYTDSELPCEETLRYKLNEMGFHLRTVRQSQPQKKPETDAIFDQLEQIHSETAQDESILRLSLDVKATVAIGSFSRRDKSRIEVKAVDHDFQPDQTVTPYGILLSDHDQLFLYFTTSRVTSDFIMGCLQDCWHRIKRHFAHVTTLLLNQDNGRENHRRRTQFVRRLTQFADHAQLTIQLAY